MDRITHSYSKEKKKKIEEENTACNLGKGRVWFVGSDEPWEIMRYQMECCQSKYDPSGLLYYISTGIIFLYDQINNIDWCIEIAYSETTECSCFLWRRRPCEISRGHNKLYISACTDYNYHFLNTQQLTAFQSNAFSSERYNSTNQMLISHIFSDQFCYAREYFNVRTSV